MTFETIKRDEILGILREAKNVKEQKKILCDMLYCTSAELEKLIAELESEKKAWHKWTERENEELIYMYNSGMETGKICERFGFEKPQALYDRVKKLRKSGKGKIEIQRQKGTKKMEEVKAKTEIKAEEKEEVKTETRAESADEVRERYISEMKKQDNMLYACSDALVSALTLIDKLRRLIAAIGDKE